MSGGGLCPDTVTQVLLAYNLVIVARYYTDVR